PSEFTPGVRKLLDNSDIVKQAHGLKVFYQNKEPYYVRANGIEDYTTAEQTGIGQASNIIAGKQKAESEVPSGFEMDEDGSSIVNCKNCGSINIAKKRKNGDAYCQN
ncbi:12820_t:CDS:2, partial [Racocetra persica]